MAKLGYTKAEVAALSNIGLSKNQARSYLLLNNTRGLTAGQLAKHLGASRTNVYPVLTDLKQKGFITELDVLKPSHYFPVPLPMALVAYASYQREQVKPLLIKQSAKQN